MTVPSDVPESPEHHFDAKTVLLFFCSRSVYNHFLKRPNQNRSKGTLLLLYIYPVWFGRITSREETGAREIRKSHAGRRHRRPRVRKHVRNVSSDARVTYTGRRSVIMEYI